MAKNMILYYILLAGLVIGSNAEGELSILYSPASLQFIGTEPINESFLKDVYAASLGLSVDQDSKWNGLAIADPFKTPEAVVKVAIDGVRTLGKIPSLVKIAEYPVVVDEYDPDTFNLMKHLIKQRYTDSESNLVHIKLSDAEQLASYPEVFGTINAPKVEKRTLKHLKMNVEEDYLFLTEIAALDAISKKVVSGIITPDGVVDFYEFHLTSLHVLFDFHGPSSLQVKEALPILAEALNRLSAAFQKAYDGSVLVAVANADLTHSRRVVRAATPTYYENDAAKDSYSADYAAIFNIILWFSVVFVFSLIAIVYVLIDMDPGRDSIIYRMTTMKTMKKEN